METLENNLTPEQEYLMILRRKLELQEKTIAEQSKTIALLSDSLSNVVGVQNEIAKQVMFLTETVSQVNDLLVGPQPSYKFFTGDEPDN